MNKIFLRIKHLLSQKRTPVYMIIDHDGEKIEIKSVRRRSGAYYCKDRYGEERELNPDADWYQTVNYKSPLFF